MSLKSKVAAYLATFLEGEYVPSFAELSKEDRALDIANKENARSLDVATEKDKAGRKARPLVGALSINAHRKPILSPKADISPAIANKLSADKSKSTASAATAVKAQNRSDGIRLTSKQRYHQRRAEHDRTDAAQGVGIKSFTHDSSVVRTAVTRALSRATDKTEPAGGKYGSVSGQEKRDILRKSNHAGNDNQDLYNKSPELGRNKEKSRGTGKRDNPEIV